MEYYIIVYKNTLDAMNAEKILGERKLSFKIMPTPTSITKSCGICTRFENKADVELVMKEKLINYEKVYHKNREGFELIS